MVSKRRSRAKGHGDGVLRDKIGRPKAEALAKNKQGRPPIFLYILGLIIIHRGRRRGSGIKNAKFII